MLTAQQIASGLGDLLFQPLTLDQARLTFIKAVVDSRAATAGDLFVALPGARADGHDFIGDAIQRGATGILAKRWPNSIAPELRGRATLFQVDDPLTSLQALARWWRTQCSTKVIGVTGSVGKTSTKEAIAAVLGSKANVFKNKFRTDRGFVISDYEPGDIAIGHMANLVHWPQPLPKVQVHHNGHLFAPPAQ